MTSAVYRTGDPIYDHDGKCLGVMTACGPIFSVSPSSMDFIHENESKHIEGVKKHLTRICKVAKEQRMATLLDHMMIDPSLMANSLNDLTIEERRIIEYALRNNDCVNLPYVVNCVSARKDMSTSTKHSIEVAMSRAASRLYNRGLGTVEKRADNLIWCSISRERVLDIIRRETAARDQGGTPTFNLMKVQCEIPTIESGSEKTKIVHPVTDIPRRANNERIKACRLLAGIKTLARPDKVEINYRFDCYSADVNEKIIALLDVNNGEIIGSEYSTRFNDIAKAARSLNNFDAALKNSFEENSKAVFLTLTTDPNLTDGEHAALHESKLCNLRSKLKNKNLSEWKRKSLEKDLLKEEGPDYEINEIEVRISSGTLSKETINSYKRRLDKLKAEKEEAKRLQAAVDDPKTPIRTREKMITSIKKMHRWEYKHDPNGFENLWEANRSFSKAWNKFLTYITKNNEGIRPKYIAAYEFTETGLLHVHALIFVNYLMPNDQISREWRRCGQGEISYIYALRAVKSRDGTGWEWRWNSQSRPHESKGMSGGDYLKKYVKKCMLAIMDDYTSPSEIQSLYWAFNKRMFTCSRSLQDPPDEVSIEENVVEASFAFFKILNDVEADNIVDRMVYHRIRPGWRSTDRSSAEAVTS